MSRRKKHPAIVVEPIEVVDQALDVELLRDVTAWERVGRELLAVDPRRYLEILKVALEICAIHRDPLGPATPRRAAGTA